VSTAQDRAVPAIRVTFYLDEQRGQSRIVNQARMTKRLAPTPRSRERDNSCGFWIELRNGLGEVVYEDAIDDPTRREGPPLRDGARGVRAEEADAPAPGLISLVVPQVPGATRLVIMASRPEDAPAVPIADLDIAGDA
jgi:hypothetical protein